LRRSSITSLSEMVSSKLTFFLTHLFE
jgi:hypothetical protein